MESTRSSMCTDGWPILLQAVDNWSNFEAYGLRRPVGLIRSDLHKSPFRDHLEEVRVFLDNLCPICGSYVLDVHDEASVCLHMCTDKRRCSALVTGYKTDLWGSFSLAYAAASRSPHGLSSQGPASIYRWWMLWCAIRHMASEQVAASLRPTPSARSGTGQPTSLPQPLTS